MRNLNGKVAAIFAATGEIAGAVARSFALDGAKVYVSGRDFARTQQLADEINQNGGWAEAEKVDALDENEIDAFLQHIVDENRKLDIVFNGIGLRSYEGGTGTPSTTVSFADFMKTFEVHCGAQFLTSRAAARYMKETKSEGTIITLNAGLSRLKFPFTVSITTACNAIEGLTRVMAAEFGMFGVKVICLNSGAINETRRMTEVNSANAKNFGISMDEFIAKGAASSLLKTSLTLKHIGEVASFLASDSGIVFNSHIMDVDCGRANVL